LVHAATPFPDVNLSNVDFILREQLDQIDKCISQNLPYSESSIIVMNFLHLVDRIVDLSQSWKPDTFIKSCTCIMATDRMPFFSNEYVEKLYSHRFAISVIRRLSFLWTWNDHSVLRHLVGFSNKAISILDDFDSQINLLQPVQMISLFPYSSSTVVDVDSTSMYRKVILTIDKEVNCLTLQDLNNVQAFFALQCKIAPLVLQLLAVKSSASNNSTRLHYMIPQCVVSDVVLNICENKNALFYKGIIEIEAAGLVMYTEKVPLLIIFNFWVVTFCIIKYNST